MEMLYLRNFLSTFFLIIIIIESFFEVTVKKKQTQKNQNTKYRAQAFSARPWFAATTH